MSLDPQVFTRRRRRFMDAIGDGAAAIFPAAPEAVRSNDTEYRYRQQSDFQYLTGFPEPGAVCLLLPGRATDEYILFVRPRDRERETWTGKRVGVEGAIERFGAQMAYTIDQLDQKLPEYLGTRERIYYALDRDDSFNQRVIRWVAQLQATRPRTGSGPTGLLDARAILHEMRLRKEAEELELMRRAIAITAEAHTAAMRYARPGRYEFEVEALLEYTFRRSGASGPAYPSIVASGANATVLHYISNDRVMADGDLLLVDAGAEYDCYCADVTRTLPVGRAFDGRQRALYELVLNAQLAAIEMIEPGVRIDALHQRAVAVLVDGLLTLGLLAGSADEIRQKELYKPLYMHRTSHWLGMDVHDVGHYKVADESRQLEPGMVLTVEPGLYVAEHLEDTDHAWHGLGVRIEDDVLVTEHGHEVLSAAVPKKTDELEDLRRESYS